MNTSRLFLASVLVLNGAEAVDCSIARPWINSVYPELGVNVHHENILYTNAYYASNKDVPGVATVWSAKGTCDEGTAGDGPTYDCSDLDDWSAQAYQAKSTVKHVDRAWSCEWYINPGEQPGVSASWFDQGVCGGPATGSTAVPTTGETTTGPKITIPPVSTTPGTTATPGSALSTIPSTQTTTTTKTSPPTTGPARFFGPFVDATLSKIPSFPTLIDMGVKRLTLGFIVAGSTGCTPSWGGYYTVPNVPWQSFTADVKTLRSAGGDIIVSFGGAAGTELAHNVACQASTETLKNAYLAVVDAYDVTHINFDIEGAFIDLTYRGTAWAYRFDAVKALVAERPNLLVSWTFPVLPSGLLNNALTFVSDIMAKDVPFSYFQIMTMNFGSATCQSNDMSECEEQAIMNTASQVYEKAKANSKAQAYGWTSVDSVFPYLSTCPMIGTNDVNTEIYTLDNAKTSLNVWKTTMPIGWLSMWSLGRDSPCPDKWASPLCTGNNVQTADLEYSHIFANFP